MGLPQFDPTPVRWGFLGAGAIATSALAPAVHAAAGASLAAVGAREVARAASLGADRAVTGYEAVLADPAVEAVYIALANDAHRPWALAALAAGKHVLCEKPLALDVAEVAELAAAAAAAGRLLVEASFYQWHPRVARARELLAAGAIGRVVHVDGGFGFDGVAGLRAGANYRLDPARGGGAGYDVGCYPVSAVLWAAGDDAVREVAAQAVVEGGVDLTTDLVLDLADGADAACHASIAGPDRQWLTITGEAGEIGLPAPSFTARDAPCVLEVSDGRGTRREEFAPVDPYRLMVEAVSAAVRGQDAWVVPLTQSRANAAVLAAGRASAAAGGAPVAVAL